MQEPYFVSHQVSESRRYYLDLKPQHRSGLTVVCGGVERMLPEYSVSRKDFPFLAIEFVVEGEGRLILNKKKYDLLPGVIFAYGPGVAHTIQNNPRHSMRKYYIDISGADAFKLLRKTKLEGWKALRVDAVHEIVNLFESLDREARNEGDLSRDVCASIARTLLIKIRQRTVSEGSKIPRSFTTYEKIRQHIQAHASRLISIEDVARECHVTPVYVSRMFRRFGATGAYQYLLHLKMNHAAKLLREEGLLVKEVSARLGYADSFQFTRAFKRVFGVAPSQMVVQ